MSANYGIKGSNVSNIFNDDCETKRCVAIVDPIIKKLDEKFMKIEKTPDADKYFINPNFRKYTNNVRSFKKTDKAYATLLIVDETYLPSVLVLGHSLRKFKNKYNLICMVQDRPEKKMIGNTEKEFKGVSKEGIAAILEIYDVVYGIDLLQLEPPKQDKHFTQRIAHYKNISIYVSKSQVFGLLEYKRILYMDASTVAHANLDYFFKEYEKNTYLYDSSVPKTDMGIHGAIFLIEPNKRMYNKSLYLIHNYNKIFGDLYFKRGIDETILYFTVFPHWSKKLIKVWTRCTEDYFYKKCPIYHYQICKPFKPLGNNIENKEKYTFRIWDKFAKELLAKHPEFTGYFKHICEFRNVNYAG